MSLTFSNLPLFLGIEGAFYEPGSKTVIPRKVCSLHVHVDVAQSVFVLILGIGY